ncbi:hypothetical protein ACFLSK_00245, partial [Chloroflexota bacterium]
EAIEEEIEQPVQPQEEAIEEKKRQRKFFRKAPTPPQEEAIEEEIEQPVQPQEEAIEEKKRQRKFFRKAPTPPQEEAIEEEIEQPVQPQEEAMVSEPVVAATEESLPEERLGRKEAGSAGLELDSQALYGGAVELDIAVPVELKMVSNLYNYLQTVPELKILYFNLRRSRCFRGSRRYSRSAE